MLRESLMQRESAGRQTLCLRSCHSLWIFDVDRRLFRRLPGATDVDIAGAGAWEFFVGLNVNPVTGAFTVTLNDEGTRFLRSWLHDEPCRHCGSGAEDATGEILLRS